MRRQDDDATVNSRCQWGREGFQRSWSFFFFFWQEISLLCSQVLEQLLSCPVLRRTPHVDNWGVRQLIIRVDLQAYYCSWVQSTLNLLPEIYLSICLYPNTSTPDLTCSLVASVRFWHASIIRTCLILYNNFTFFFSHTCETLIKHATAIHVEGKKKQSWHLRQFK